jgi:hypothetical protein
MSASRHTAEEFDPAAKRAYLESASGYTHTLRRSFDEAKANQWLGSNATANLNEAVNCIAVGLFEAARLLL